MQLALFFPPPHAAGGLLPTNPRPSAGGERSCGQIIRGGPEIRSEMCDVAVSLIPDKHIALDELQLLDHSIRDSTALEMELVTNSYCSWLASWGKNRHRSTWSRNVTNHLAPANLTDWRESRLTP